MPRYIIKLTDKNKKDWYLEWSTIVDAPITYGMNMAQLKKYIKEEYGNVGLEDLPKRLERVARKGHSAMWPTSVEKLIAHNRAGHEESSISVKKIIEHFCLRKASNENIVL